MKVLDMLVASGGHSETLCVKASSHKYIFLYFSPAFLISRYISIADQSVLVRS